MTTKAERALEQLMEVLRARGLEAPVRRAVLVEAAPSRAWLFVDLRVAEMRDLRPYMHPETLHHLRAALERPVFALNSRGFRYAVALGELPRLPERIPFPGPEAGWIRIGQGPEGEARLPFGEAFGHGLAVGLTGTGKSNLLLLVAAQWLAAGGQVVVIDPHRRLLWDLEHPGILRRAGLREAPEAVGMAEQLLEARSEGGEAAPRVLLVVDEVPALATFHQGLMERLAALAWQGRKFGIHLLAGAQEGTRAVLGPLRDAATWAACFRVRSSLLSRMVIGRPGAEAIRVRGRALTDPWGIVQVYLADPREILQAPLDRRAREILEEAARAGGYVTFEWLRAHGLTSPEARALLERLRAVGLLEKDPRAKNAHRLTEAARAMLGGELSSSANSSYSSSSKEVAPCITN